ncbi:cytochrome P450 [Streptomyces sp. NPDC001514]
MDGGPPTLMGGPHVYDRLAELAERAPLVRVLLHGTVPAWLLTRPADILEAARDPRLTSDDAVLGHAGRSWVKFGFMSMDGAEHLRLRRIVASAFTPRRTAALEPYVTDTVDELVDPVAPAGRADLVADLALPLPMVVLCKLLGVPIGERAQFEGTVNALVRASADRPSDARAARAALYDYLTDLVCRKRRKPSDDLLSELATASQLCEREIVETGALLLVAGYETTANLIGAGSLVLLTHPEQLRLIRDAPTTLPDVVDELVRYRGPVAIGATRYTREPVTIAGSRIPARERIVLGFGAANHDPDRFPSPHRLDVTRPSTVPSVMRLKS